LKQMSRSRHAVLSARAHQIDALLAAEADDVSEASSLLDQAERALRRIDDVFGFIDLLTDRGRVLLWGGHRAAAHQAYVNAAALARAIGARLRLIRAIEGVACAVVDTRPSLCVQLAAAATASRRVMQTVAWPRDARDLNAALNTARRYAGRWPDAASTGVGSATFGQVWQTGTLLPESDLAAIVMGTLNSKPPKTIADIPASLTMREWEIAQLFAGGASARQIAERLTLSRDTVRTHLDRASSKLGLHSRVQLALWVARSQAEPV